MQRYKRCANIPMDASTMMNVVTIQCHRFYANIPMHACVMVNVTMMQHHRFYINIPMNVCTKVNDTTMQLGTSCSFDSPGLPNNSAGYPGLMCGLRGTTP